MMQTIHIMLPELLLTVTIFLVLLSRIGSWLRPDTVLVGTQLLLLLLVLLSLTLAPEGKAFGGMFVSESLHGCQKAILTGGVYLITLVCSNWLRRCAYLPEFLVLMLSALLGLFFLISSGHLLQFFLALELSTLPLAALANFELEKRKSSEAAMKMILSSAFASGILLFGISLVYGATGTLLFSELSTIVQPDSLQMMALVFVFSAFAFKLSVVPFHLWTADVYEGSPLAVTSFFSVISKGAIAFVFVTALYKVWLPLQAGWEWLLVWLALATMVTGNLFALRQDQLKRFLAFSSITQVGFILVAISGHAADSEAAVTYFVLVYTFSNLAAFGVASVVEEGSGVDSISGLRGLAHRNPFLAWVMALALFSLAGIPPTAGFFGKLFLLMSGAAGAPFWLIVAAVLNMVVSLYYYLRIVRMMFMEEESSPGTILPVDRFAKLGLLLCTAGVLLLGLSSWIYDYIRGLA